MARYVVAAVDEIPPGSRKIVTVANRSIGIFNLGGEFFALRNRCPHQGAELCLGHVGGFVTASGPGYIEYSREGEILRCPWHGWEFDIRTGQSWFDPKRVRVKSYDVAVETTPASSTGGVGGESGYQPGPFAAERYDVTVEKQQVVVEIRD